MSTSHLINEQLVRSKLDTLVAERNAWDTIQVDRHPIRNTFGSALIRLGQVLMTKPAQMQPRLQPLPQGQRQEHGEVSIATAG